MRRILVYSHDTFGLGNIRRMLAVSNHLVAHDEDVTVLLVSGSNALPSFRLPARADYLKLPCLKRDQRGNYDVRSLAIDYADVIEMRANLILSAMLDFKPEIILVDKKPFGVSNELDKVLHVIARRVQQPRMLLLLRDILDDAAATQALWEKNGYHDIIASFYDSVLVAGDPSLYELGREYDFPAATRNKLVYCGLIDKPAERSRATVRTELGIGAQRLIVVTPGGGEDGSHLMNAYLNAFADAPLPNTHSLLFLGSEFNATEANSVKARAAATPGFTCRDFTADMPGYLGAADAVVCMGGYNTVYEALGAAQTPVIVPRVRPVSEQWIRASRLQQLDLARCLHPDQLTRALMQRSIEWAFERRTQATARDTLNFDGLANISQHVLNDGRQAVQRLAGSVA